MKDRQQLRLFAAYMVGVLLIISLLTALFILPYIKKTAENQHRKDTIATLQTEAEIFRRFVSRHAQALHDLASFPVVTNAVLLSSHQNPNLVDLMENSSIAGQKGQIVLQDIEGKAIYRSTAGSTHFIRGTSPEFRKILAGNSAFSFLLVGQRKENMEFVLSVPIKYRGSIEGVLSAALSVPLRDVFSPQMVDNKVDFIIRQGEISARTNTGSFVSPKNYVESLKSLNAELVYVQDENEFLSRQTSLRKRILLTLLGGSFLSFLAFAVLGYRAFSREDRKETSLDKKAFMAPVAMGALGIVASAMAAYFLFSVQKEHRNEDFKKHNAQQIENLEKLLFAKMRALDMLEGVFRASDSVSKDEFNTFTHTILRHHPNIEALEWVPEVTDQNREDLEKKGRELGYRDFQITQRGKNGDLVRAERRDTYYPVFYMSPLKGNEKALGFDLASNKTRRDALLKAKINNQTTATKPIKLVQKKEGENGILVFRPIHKYTQEKERVFKGFVLGVFQVGDIVGKSQLNNFKDTKITIEDVTKPAETIRLFGDGTVSDEGRDCFVSKILNIAGRQWKISAVTNPGVDQSHLILLSLSVFVTGLVVSLLVAYTFLQLVRRRQVTENIVVERTREVKELSDAMEKTVEGVSRINPEGKYIYVNEAYASACGYKPEDLVGGHWSTSVYEEDMDLMKETYQRMKEEGKASAQPRGVRRDGSVFYKCVTMISRHCDNGEFIGHHCFMRDITKRKAAELELLRSNKELDDFAYIASHDLKEPLRGIHNHTKLFLEDFEHTLDEEASHRMNRIAYLSGRMEKLVTDLLYYSRLGRQETVREEVDLNEIVFEEQHLFADHDDVQITLETKLPVIMCDKTRIGELFRNLIANSIKYNDSELKNIAIGVKKEHNTTKGKSPLIFYVKDNGIGIDKRFHEDIFKIFKRLHKRDAYGGGTGSGLTFVKKIIEQHGGEIWVQSEPGQGTAFYFTLGA